jgi:hypothetical protein
MRRMLHAAATALASAFLAMPSGPVMAQGGHLTPSPWADISKITINYGPASDELRPIRDLLVNAKVLERLQRFLASYAQKLVTA